MFNHTPDSFLQTALRALIFSFTTALLAHAATPGTRINVGGTTATDAQGNVWSADVNFVGGTVPAASTNAINVSAVTNPAPTAAYQTERYGACTYTIPGQTAGAAYTVRLHFAEVYFTAANLRKFNVLLNGTQVLTNFDIFATAGAMNKAVVQQFSTTANASGQIVLQFAIGTVNNPKICGIEVIPNGPPPAPVITSATVASGRVGMAFSYQITASNAPTSFSASPLPAGLGINTVTGLISGTPTAAATSSVTLRATNAGGTGSAALNLTITSGAGTVKINSGGPVSGTFAADAYFTGGTVTIGTNTISTVGATNPAPVAVYQSERWGPSSYTIPGLTPNAAYVVRLHFAEIWFTGATGQGAAGTGLRKFNVLINGTTVLANFDITAAAGGANKAIVKEFDSTANASGQVTVQFTVGTADNPKISGIELNAGVLPPPPAPVITSALTATGSVNTPFSYQITASNNPTSFSATGLPAGLSVNSATGLISGTPTATGSSPVTLTAANAGGLSAPATLNLTVTAANNFPAGLAVSPQLNGQNNWNPLPTTPDSIWTVIGDSSIGMMRIGGHQYDQVPFDNATLLKYVDLIRAIGAEPLIQVSRYVANGPAVAAATVNYINVVNKRNVKYWTIGNEPDLKYAGTDDQFGAWVAGYTKSIAPAMRDQDPTIKIFAAELSGYSQSRCARLLGGAYDITGTDSKGRYYIDGFSIHSYPFNGTQSRDGVITQMHTGLQNTVNQLLAQLASASQLHNRTGAKALTWMMGEYNIDWANPTSNGLTGNGVSSFLNGQFFAEYLRVGMETSAVTFDTWSVNEGGGNGSTGDLGNVGGSFTAPIKRSSYYHMQMIGDFMMPGGYLASKSSNGYVGVNATSVNAQTQLAVMILNEDTAAHNVTVRMDDAAVGGTGDTKINVSAGHATEYTGSVAGQATVILIFDHTGALKKRVTYSLTRYQNNQAPLVEAF